MNPFNKSQRIEIEDGFFIAWEEMGHGPPLVLLHGVMANNRTWRHVAPILSDRYRILLPDLPGHGNSDCPDASYTLAWYAKALLAWLDELGVDTVHLCGHSFGGGVAQWMVLEDRARIDRLALVATGGLGKEVGFPLRLATFPVCGPALAPIVIRAMIRLMLTYGQKTFGKNEPEEIDILVQQMKKPGSMRAFQRTVNAVINLNGQYMQTWQRIKKLNHFHHWPRFGATTTRSFQSVMVWLPDRG